MDKLHQLQVRKHGQYLQLNMLQLLVQFWKNLQNLKNKDMLLNQPKLALAWLFLQVLKHHPGQSCRLPLLHTELS